MDIKSDDGLTIANEYRRLNSLCCSLERVYKSLKSDYEFEMENGSDSEEVSKLRSKMLSANELLKRYESSRNFFGELIS